MIALCHIEPRCVALLCLLAQRCLINWWLIDDDGDDDAAAADDELSLPVWWRCC
jgi:hypothetical protein